MSESLATEPAHFDASSTAAPEESYMPGPQKKQASPKTDRARAIVRPLVEAGLAVNPEKLAKKHGLTEHAVNAARAMERGRLEGLQEAVAALAAPIDPLSLSQTQQTKLEALEQRLRAKLESEYHDRVQEHITRHINEYLMPSYKAKLEKAEVLMKIGKPFTTTQYLSLLRALHDDSTSPENRQEAFVLLKAKEVLLRPEEREKPLTSGLPETVAELLARRKGKR